MRLPGRSLDELGPGDGAARGPVQAKADTMKRLWVPAVNNHGGLGRWAFLEIRDIYDAEKAIRECLAPSAPRRVA